MPQHSKKKSPLVDAATGLPVTLEGPALEEARKKHLVLTRSGYLARLRRKKEANNRIVTCAIIKAFLEHPQVPAKTSPLNKPLGISPPKNTLCQEKHFDFLPRPSSNATETGKQEEFTELRKETDRHLNSILDRVTQSDQMSLALPVFMTVSDSSPDLPAFEDLVDPLAMFIDPASDSFSDLHTGTSFTLFPPLKRRRLSSSQDNDLTESLNHLPSSP